MVKTKRTALMLALGMLLVLFSTAFAAAPPPSRVNRPTFPPPPSQQLQAGWSGWGEVSGNGFTLSGPAPTFDQKNDYLFVRGTNNHLYMNTSNGTTVSGWKEVPGTMLTPSAPAATTSGTTVYLFVRGTNNKIYKNTLANGTTWSGWSEVPGNGLTPDAPGAMGFAPSASGAGQLELFVRGTNNRIYVNSLSG